MIYLAVLATVFGVIGIYARLLGLQHPTRESLRKRGSEWGFEVYGFLAPYLLTVATLLWLAVGIEHWA